MPIDARHLGRRYGPYRFEVGLERIRDFVAAVGGGVPGRVFSAPPPDPHPFTWEEAAARASRHRGLVAPPAFATAFAIQPFAVACSDPELGLNVLRLVHGEQEFELFGQLRPGDTYLCRTRVVDITQKAGRSGPMAFVTRETAITDVDNEIVATMRHITVIRL